MKKAFLLLLLIPKLAFASPTQVEFLLSGAEDSNGDPLASGKVYTYAAGTTTNKDTWTDLAETTPQANPIILDANGKAQVFADGLYKFVIKDSSDVTLYTWDNLSYGESKGTTVDGGTSSGAANTYAITVAPNPIAYDTGQKFSFITHQANTSSATLNVNGIGAAALRSKTGQVLVGGEIKSGAVVLAYYDGSVFRIINTTPVPNVAQAYSNTTANTSSGTAATMTGATVTVSIKSGDYVKLNWWTRWSVNNTGTTCTFSLFQDSTELTSTAATLNSAGDVDSTGAQNSYAGNYIITIPSTGSVTYTIKWLRASGANVCYSSARYISAEVISP